MQSSTVLRRVAPIRTDVSEEHIASIMGDNELGTP
jgi:hypothetical protein